ncbi:UDP-N-acetylenolpyruvoylglucosamine reductase [Acetobacter estunensis NRIC 0472]|uniref:UDP-N-acetylenolpyruvoylglucosamine reductase n=1 Tax=Acetobacter estunensis TaxID=104097 RepID=A0A967B5G7_9PROT|nr:UDP-N-acetylmuramate dehydrogenase [Acetobacter estunensis]NHO53594.1 UDP-N-acetylmuramate dehydrogenase [Acetobacter estunensis]GBQ20993.1 UDP-N-acetylenolpyruvoylglucosamine reductase [Acetobacter estunensis NRIC 0472]
MNAQPTHDLKAALGDVRGRVTAGQPLAPRSWFRVGGPAECLFQPADAEDLATGLARLSPELPVTTLGACSNIIIRDGGIPGLVIRLGGAFAGIEVEKDGLIAGGAALDATVAETAAANGLGGLEFLAGIPGSIGGAVRMNAGAYGADMAAVLDWAEIVSRDGSLMRLDVAALRFGYRRSALPDGAVVVRARLRAQPADPAVVAGRIGEIRAAREGSQPVRARTGGSTFRNPDPAESPLMAWQLVDAAGCRGLTIGGAQVSEKHCNFLINTGTATATDLETLGETVRKRVQEKSGVTLHWEIKRIGLPRSEKETAQ